uniref:Uncharacterized protein n=1 Tax=Glossina austeni TaxID=7395 RepID=A0A1A9VIM1_GLOAU
MCSSDSFTSSARPVPIVAYPYEGMLSRDKYKYGRVKCSKGRGNASVSESNAIAIENYSKQRFFGSLVFNGKYDTKCQTHKKKAKSLKRSKQTLTLTRNVNVSHSLTET